MDEETINVLILQQYVFLFIIFFYLLCLSSPFGVVKMISLHSTSESALVGK